MPKDRLRKRRRRSVFLAVGVCKNICNMGKYCENYCSARPQKSIYLDAGTSEGWTWKNPSSKGQEGTEGTGEGRKGQGQRREETRERRKKETQRGSPGRESKESYSCWKAEEEGPRFWERWRKGSWRYGDTARYPTQDTKESCCPCCNPSPEEYGEKTQAECCCWWAVCTFWSTPNVPGDGGNHKDAKELALLEKIKTNHELLKNVLEFGSDVHYFPTLEDNPSMRSFTVHPYAESRGQKSIGVILFRSSFYVYRANIPDGLQKILDQKGVKGAIGKDSNGGCSLGWTRFKSVQQAYLSLYMLTMLFFETMCVRESLNICYFKMCASLWCLFVSGICVHNDQVLAWLLRWGLAKIVGGWVPEDKMAEHVFEWVIMGTGLPTKWQLPGVFFEVTLGFAPTARLQHMVVHKPLFQLSPSMMEAWGCVVSCVWHAWTRRL